MTESDAYCDFCDLPLAQCIHGRPPPVAVATPPKPKKRTPARPRVADVAKPVNLRWTPPAVFKPLILEVLREAGGELDVDDLYLELEIAAEDQLRPGDSETTPSGELRWQYAARRARLELVDEGLMVKGTPGVWRLA